MINISRLIDQTYCLELLQDCKIRILVRFQNAKESTYLKGNEKAVSPKPTEIGGVVRLLQINNEKVQRV